MIIYIDTSFQMLHSKSTKKIQAYSPQIDLGGRKMFHVPDVLFWEIVFTTNY